MESNPPAEAPTSSSSQPPAAANAITRELVLQIAERVYTLMLEDLRIARERRRNTGGQGVHYGQ